ncbi:MAG: pilus assembly protein TadG-related protein, partial [Aeromicrobium sp.]
MRSRNTACDSMTDPLSVHERSRGQVLVVFAGSVLLLMMMAALVVDVAWFWVNSLRVQRAADAAALAGAVMLPSRVPDAFQLAEEE